MINELVFPLDKFDHLLKGFKSGERPIFRFHCTKQERKKLTKHPKLKSRNCFEALYTIIATVFIGGLRLFFDFIGKYGQPGTLPHQILIIIPSYTGSEAAAPFSLISVLVTFLTLPMAYRKRRKS